ncbi:transcriptional regulator [Prauserella sp. PE36]|uniref:Sugar-binding transcriptional regulator n=1 Tax=Prauserella endophytica TaxID=1592324 RepID=A0ABY2S6F4_9PSEU|nr:MULTISPECIES: sugar-binding transcriptional regulator [Prauserella]PXY21682.1 transcriptional regulator [Prauserella coralliicola]RBM20058.1 transcriptional regulator [Prauserella sp. PE36]TKG71465.1 sugar-binding transcriptional regulator [Prauserella endophytica]
MPPPRDQQLLVKAARLYYEEGRSQNEIATTLQVSRSSVSRMLTAARERGIVRIQINDPTGRDMDLEAELTARFGLRDCRVAEIHSGDRPLSRVGDLGARWLLENLQAGQQIGVSWGHGLQSVVQHIPDEGGLDVEVLPLVGGLSAVDSAISGEELVRDLAGRVGGRYQRLHAPALLTSKAGRDVLLAEPSVQATLDAARRVQVAIVGIGSVGQGSSAALVKAMNLSAEEQARFDAARPVGDVCARFFDAEGTPLAGPSDDHVLAVSLADLAAIPTVAGVAAGPEKAGGVLGALRTGVLDVLVCDSSLARALLTRDAR